MLAAVALLMTVAFAEEDSGAASEARVAQILAAGLGTINSTLGSVIGGGLQSINTVLSDISNFEQTVIWPRQAITRALGMAGQIQGFYAQIRGIFRIPISSATLQNPKQLESILLSRNPGQIPSMTGGYGAVYGAVPTPRTPRPRSRHHRHYGRSGAGRDGACDRHRRNRGPGARRGRPDQHERSERHARQCADYRGAGGRLAGESTRVYTIRTGGSDEGPGNRSCKQRSSSEAWQLVGGNNATECDDNAATQIAMFYFQQLFNTAMGGIDSGGATAGAVQVAQYVLLASLLFGVYESWARGGDTHFLGATAVRYFAVGLVMINYSAAFRDVNGMFNNVASFINTSTAGGGDVFGQWMSDLSNYWNNNNGIQALWGLITGAFSGVLESLLLMVGYILFPVTYALFSLFYTLYGSILYVVGPFVSGAVSSIRFWSDGQKVSCESDDFQRLGIDLFDLRCADGGDQHELGEHGTQQREFRRRLQRRDRIVAPWTCQHPFVRFALHSFLSSRSG